MSNLPTNSKTGNDRMQTTPAPGAAALRVRVREAARLLEAKIILEALEQHRWNRRRTAEALGISYRLLMYKMRYCDLRATPVSRPDAS